MKLIEFISFCEQNLHLFPELRRDNFDDFRREFNEALEAEQDYLVKMQTLEDDMDDFASENDDLRSMVNDLEDKIFRLENV